MKFTLSSVNWLWICEISLEQIFERFVFFIFASQWSIVGLEDLGSFEICLSLLLLLLKLVDLLLLASR